MKTILTLFLALIAGALIAQNDAFVALAVRGQVSVNNKKITMGTKLPANTVVNLAEGAYLGLMHKSGKTAELKTPGNIDLSPINTKLAGQGKGFQDKYVDYVVKGMTQQKGGDGPYQKNMSITGSVDRALRKNEIVIPYPQKCWINESNFQIVWLDHNSGHYVLSVRNMKEEVVYTVETDSKEARIDLSAIKLDPDQYYLMHVIDPKTRRFSNVINLYNPSESQKKAFEAELADVKESIDKESALGQLSWALLLREKKLFIEADQAFRKALILDPTNKAIDELYTEFKDQIAAEL